MADKFWKPASNDWGDTNNWSATQTGATGAGVPANTNDVYVQQGSYSIGATLDQSAVTLNSLSFQDGFGGSGTGFTIGTGTPFKINVTNSLLIASNRISLANIFGTIGTIDLRKFV